MKKSNFIRFAFLFGILLIFPLFITTQKIARAETFSYSYIVTNLQPSSCLLGSEFTPSNLISPGDMVRISGIGFGNRNVTDGIAEMLYTPVSNALRMIYRAQRNDGGQTIYFGLHSWSDNAIDIEVAQGQGGSLGSYIVLKTYTTVDNQGENCVRGTLSPICTSTTYSDWGACQPNGTQTRTVLSSSPNGCSVVNPILSQSCTYTPPTCTSFTYSDWGICSNGQQARSIVSSSPNNCTGGTPVLTQACTPTCILNDYSCGNWDTCSADGAQIRTCTKNSTCEGGILPPTSQSCTYTAPTCTSWTYSDWGICAANGQQTRTIISSLPAGCAGGNAILSQNCTPTCIADTWSCADWLSCSADSLQTRTCTKTLDCPNIDTSSPAISQSCTYVPPAPKIAPVITSIAPEIIEKGTLVTLRGSKFMNLGPYIYGCSNCKTLINGSEVSGISAYSWYEDHVSFSMPSNATSGYIQVQDSKGNISEKFNFTIKTFADQHPISITSVLPTVIIPGELITVTGNGFGIWDTATTLTIGGIDLKLVTSWNDTTIKVAFPLNGEFGQKIRIKKCKSSWNTSADECSYAVSTEIISEKKFSNDLYSRYQWYLENINAKAAWGITQGSPDVVVAVIDSGVDTNHEDLTQNIWLKDKGYNFAYNIKEMTPYDWHGTAVAGIIAAQKDNGLGITGIAPNIKILPLTVFPAPDENGNTSAKTEDIVEAIKYAVDKGATIINLSLGGKGSTLDYQPTYDEIFKYTYDKNVLVITAAGNGDSDILGQPTGRGQNLELNPTSPACNNGNYKQDNNKNGIWLNTDHHWVIGVGATDKRNSRTGWSNYSEKCVDVWAPGEDFFITAPVDYGNYADSYKSMPIQGTSFAAPIVTGVAALIKSQHPDWNVEEIRAVLMMSQTNGVIDAFKAVTASRPDVRYEPQIHSSIDPTKFENQSITVTIDSEISNEVPITGTVPFPDIENSKYQEAINILKKKKFVKGNPDGSFKPFNTLNRAEFLTILMHNLPGEIPEAPKAGCGFSDVKTSDWFAKSICFAKSKGYAKGYPDGSFKPGNPVNFVEALALTERIFGWPISEDKEEWFRPFVISAEAKNIIPESINSFAQKVTREEMAELIVRFIKNQEGSLDSYLGKKSSKITYVCLKNGTCNVTNKNITPTAPTEKSSQENANDQKKANKQTNNIPKNGYKYKTTWGEWDWDCNDGYFKNWSRLSCEKIVIPEDGYLETKSWRCKSGYTSFTNNRIIGTENKIKNICIKIKLPENAYLDAEGNNWFCNKGYVRDYNTCKKIEIPTNAHQTIFGWECNEGYKQIKQAGKNTCQKK